MKLLDLLSFRITKSVLFLSLILPFSATATTVDVVTPAGTFRIDLFDFDPDVQATVDNFLLYVNGGFYDSTYFHRLAPGFVLQGGGFAYNGTFPAPQDTDLNLVDVELVVGEVNPTVANQPKYSSVRGTVAMAKFGGDADSASNQWFVNLANNGSNLDVQNGGFTVFGTVTIGMDVVDAMAGYTLLAAPATPDPNTQYMYQSPLGELPLTNYTNDNFAANVIPDSTNLAFITSISVVDSDPNTASTLDIVPNELILGFRQSPIVQPQEFKDGGSVGWVFLSLLSLLIFWRRKQV